MRKETTIPHPSNARHVTDTLSVRHTQGGLAKGLASEERQESLLCVLDTLEGRRASLDGALRDPLGDVLPEGGNVGFVDVVVPEDEALDVNALAENVRQVLDAVLLLGSLVVGRDLRFNMLVWRLLIRYSDNTSTYHAADDNLSEPLDVLNTGLKVVAANVFVDTVQALRCQPLQGIAAALGSVVEAGIGAELLDDVLGLLVGADTANDAHTLLLGELHNNLANSAGRSVDPDGLALLRLDKAVEGVLELRTLATGQSFQAASLSKTYPSSLAGETKRTNPVLEGQVVLVLNLVNVVGSHALGLNELEKHYKN